MTTPIAPPAARRRHTLWLLLSVALTLLGPVALAMSMDVRLFAITGLPAFALMGGGAALGIMAARRDARKMAWFAPIISLALLAFFAAGFVLLPRLPRAEAASSAAMATDFTLPDQASRPVSLSQTLNKGPVLLVFYRGHW